MRLVRPFLSSLAMPLLCLLGASPALAQNVITYHVETRIAEKSFQVHMDILDNPTNRFLPVSGQASAPRE